MPQSNLHRSHNPQSTAAVVEEAIVTSGAKNGLANNTNSSNQDLSKALQPKPSRFLMPSWLQLFADVFASTLAWMVLYILKIISPTSHAIVFTSEFIVTVWTFSTIFWCSVFWFGGLYRNWYVRSPFDEFFAIIKSIGFGSVSVLVLLLLDNSGIRIKFFFYSGLLTLCVVIGRYIARKIQEYLRVKRIVTLRTVIVGEPNRIPDLLQHINAEPAWGYVVHSAILTTTTTTISTERWNIPSIHTINELETILKSNSIDVLLVTVDSTQHDLLLNITTIANDIGTTVKIVPDLYEIVTGQVKTLQIYGTPFIEVNPELLKPWEESAKRLFDIIFSCCVLVLGFPVWLFFAIIIRLESPGSPLYSQIRIGRLGQPFRIYKFRSMVQSTGENVQAWTIDKDPRVTRFGYFLRKSHLDEIPQMWNILVGEMSLVGPRPEQPKFVDKYSAQLPYYSRRHKVRPGLTGWWQVKYTTYTESIEEIKSRLQYDFYYIENMSLRLDFEIIARTVILVLKGHGQA